MAHPLGNINDRESTAKDWQKLLARLDVHPSKALGQNFLVDESVVARIIDVAHVTLDDSVLEIGPGLGILTTALGDCAGSVVTVELDGQLATHLRSAFAHHDRVVVVERDARYVEPTELGLPVGYKVVANLPYSSATVILRRLLERAPVPASLTAMLQREVAERMTASPPAMSLLALATQLSCEARLAFLVPSTVFVPAPRVESAVVHLIPWTAPPLDADQRTLLLRLATIAFQAKRKTLSNSLAHGLGRPKAEVASALAGLDIDPMRRPQTLTVSEWCRLAQNGFVEDHP